jgi:hypothetical protein
MLTGKLGNGYAKWKSWNWSCQREKMELDPASGKIWNCILSRGKLRTTVDPASGKT